MISNPLRRWLLASVLSLSLISTHALIARADAPTFEVAAAGESVRGEGARALIRVTFMGAHDNAQHGCQDAYVCAPLYYVVSAQAGLGLSGQSALANMDLRFTYERDPAYTMHNKADLDVLPAQFSREIAVGKEAKLKVDFFEISEVLHTDANPESDGTEHGRSFAQFFVAGSVNAIGAQFLAATMPEQGLEELTRFYGGFDVGGVTGSAGFAQNWSRGFATRITIGGKADLAIVKGNDGHGIRAASERSAYARFSAVLDERWASVEAYVQGTVGQLALGASDEKSYVSMQAGALTRF